MSGVVAEVVEDNMGLIRESLIKLANLRSTDTPLFAAEVADDLCTDILTILNSQILQEENQGRMGLSEGDF